MCGTTPRTDAAIRLSDLVSAPSAPLGPGLDLSGRKRLPVPWTSLPTLSDQRPTFRFPSPPPQRADQTLEPGADPGRPDGLRPWHESHSTSRTTDLTVFQGPTSTPTAPPKHHDGVKQLSFLRSVPKPTCQPRLQGNPAFLEKHTTCSLQCSDLNLKRLHKKHGSRKPNLHRRLGPTGVWQVQGCVHRTQSQATAGKYYLFFFFLSFCYFLGRSRGLRGVPG